MPRSTTISITTINATVAKFSYSTVRVPLLNGVN
jgi:hypothetical protein